MKKLIIFPVTLMIVLIMISPHISYAVGRQTTASATKIHQDQFSNKSSLLGYRQVKNTYNEDLFDFSKKNDQASKWSAKYFPKVFSDDIDRINSINQQLRMKYMNRSDLYEPFSDLEGLDKSFVTETSQDIVVYANLTPEDFGISSKYYSKNSEKVYNDMLKESLFGIDHGYFLGSLDKKSLDPLKNEYIQISLIVPKGSKITRVGSLSENQYIIPRDTTLSYIGKNFSTESKNVNISAQVAERRELDQATRTQEATINTKMNTLYGTPSDMITLTPLGLNAGHVLTSSSNTISKAFEEMYAGNILSKSLFDKQKFNLTSGWIVHTDVFDKWSEGETLEERRALFEKNFDTNSLGVTQIWNDKTCESIIHLSHLCDEDNLTQMSVDDSYATTLLHETFHYLIHSSNYFEDQPLFQKDQDVFKDMINMLKDEDEGKLVELLNDDYAEDDWEEFICEAFMAKFHPDDEIRNTFIKEIPQTNRMLDNIFDHTPPTVPVNLKVLEVSGTSVKLTFDHAKDNVGVDSYNIYQDGKLVKTEITEKDENYLSYPDPGNHQRNMEITLDNLKQFTDYEFQVTAVDDVQHESAKSSILKIKTKDTEPPKLTGPLTGSPLVSTAARLNWAHPTDNYQVKEVKVYRSETSSKLSNFDMQKLNNQEQTFIVSANENYYTDLTIEKGKTYSYSMVAVDESGNESAKSNSITIKTEDKDDEKQNEDKAEDMTSSKAKLDWDGAFSGISASGFSIFSWVFSGGSWVFNGVTSVAGTATSSAVDLAVGLSHQFVVIPVDSSGNPLASGLQISVDSVDKSSIKTKDSTLYTGQTWNKEDNFVSATDEDGNAVPYTDNRITTNGSSIDTSKPGVFEVKYSYKGVAKTSDSTFEVTVKEDKTKLELQDVSLYVGQNYDIDSPFKNVTDKDGNPIKASKVDWYYIDEVKTKILDTSKPGVHKVRIVYLDGANKWKYSDSCKVTVKEDKTKLELQDVNLYVGQNYDIDSPFKNVTDKDGNPIKASKVDWYYIDEVKTKILDTSKPGVHKVRIVYLDGANKWKYSDSCKVTVVSKEEWFSQISEAHKSSYQFQKGSRPSAFTAISFNNDIKDVMKGQLENYRVVYSGIDGNFDVTKPAYNYNSDGSIKVNFTEYNSGYGITIDNNTDLRIYAVLKDGQEINVYDNSEQEEWFSQISDIHKSNHLIVQQLNKNVAIRFNNNIKEVMKGQLENYRVDYEDDYGTSFNRTKPANSFNSDGSIEISFLDYNDGKGIERDPKVLKIYAVLKNGQEINVYDNRE
ncbi:bacterial Ig-like domain-containing protein [Lactococcus lactis]|uniref:bacterial Ig-like domain-containing protein n=1 Tax=Lactococcus lactis TaxID=1358 RepID=UPI0023793BB8|nr:bacterial Ig-like domain-containing protein [Lactococcus lactis]WDA67247.1 bacterial Ig-like domain-containing protein [Lactococcus lactis]